MVQTTATPTANQGEEIAGTLKIANISKAFPNVKALDDVSLDIRPGEILAFMGRTARVNRRCSKSSAANTSRTQGPSPSTARK
jgi:ABC-type phosphonate transport system ATPase subunit